MAKGTGKPCGASYISHNKVCRIGLPTAVNDALNKASHQVGIVELINAAKHVGGKGAMGKAIAIRQQLRQENPGGNLKKGEHGRELKRRLEDAGLLPKKPEKPGVSLEKKVEALAPPIKVNSAPPIPSYLLRELRELAARDQQLENPKTPSIKPEAIVKTGVGSASRDTQYAKSDAVYFDRDFKPASRQGGTYDWNETTKPGTKKIGEGSFGTVLMTKGPPPVAVKRGEVSSKEADIIEKVGKADIGPRLIAGETAKGGRTEYGVNLKNGRIAMSVVPGTPLMDMSGYTQVGNTTAGNAYWAARASLHRIGIAHNDMHPGNLLIDETGKGRWVDMGLAHNHPGAALAEALGVLQKPAGAVGVGEGDWQGKKWASYTGNSDGRIQLTAPDNLKRMQENHNTKVLPFLRSKGLDNDEIGEVMTLGIRAKPSQYTTGGFAKLSDSDALQAINLLYDGI